MPFDTDYPAEEPTRASIDQSTGLLLLEFGAPDCAFCHAIQPALEKALASATATFGDVAHQKVEDGAGRSLGRSFGVRLWPTLVLLRDGAEVKRAVRPMGESEISALFTES